MKYLTLGVIALVVTAACRDTTSGIDQEPAAPPPDAAVFQSPSASPCITAINAAGAASLVYTATLIRIRVRRDHPVAPAQSAFATLTARHNDMIAACASVATFTVAGAVSGLSSGASVTLQNNGADDLAVAADGGFAFATPLTDGAAYDVTVSSQPSGQVCTVTNGTGTISGADVENVLVQCVTTTTVSVGDLILTEVMIDPLAVADAAGEWFEISNVSSAVIDLLGVQFQNQAGAGFTVTRTLVINPGDFLVFGVNGDPSTNGGVSVDYVYSGMTLPNSNGALRILSGAAVIDEFSWVTAPNGASLQRDGSGTWCQATTAYGVGDKGTPGQMGVCS
jgi:Lamin Tail Domain